MKYKVYGTILLNWENLVEADSEEEAEEEGKIWAEDGYGLNCPVEKPEVHTVEQVEK